MKTNTEHQEVCTQRPVGFTGTEPKYLQMFSNTTMVSAPERTTNTS